MVSACAATTPNTNLAGSYSKDVIVTVQKPSGSDRGQSASSKPAEILALKPAEGYISSLYGPRKLSPRKKTRQHNGIDVSAQKGTPVIASGKGRVAFAGIKGTYGRLVEIVHHGELITRYAHLDTIVVKKGQTVAAGQKIGTVGTTGRTTGPNLHFEILVNNKHVNPLQIVTWS